MVAAMAPGLRPRGLLASLAAHAVVCAVLASLPRTASTTPPVVAASTVELSLEAPPAPAPEPVPPVPAPIIAPPPPSAARVVPSPSPRPSPHPVAPAPVSPAPTAPAPLPAPAPTAPPPPAPVLRATDLLRPRLDTFALPPSTQPAHEGPAGRGAVFHGTEGTEGERVQAASGGFLRQALADSTVREAPGVRGYFWGLRRHVAEAWRPGVVRVPNLAETLLAGFIPPERALRIFGERIARRQRQVLEAPAPREGGAADAIEAMGGVYGQGLNGRPPPPPGNLDESWRRNVRTTRAELEVDQDDTGRIVAVRLVHASGIPTFDRAAEEAVRHGAEAVEAAPLPGGRRSRWSFTVVATRRLFTPSIGGGFDESRGWFRVEVPGQVNVRSRVALEASGPLPAPR